MNFCKFCSDYTGFTPINDTMLYSTIEISINPKIKLLRVRTYPNGYDGGFEHTDFIQIENCPVCGRKL